MDNEGKIPRKAGAISRCNSTVPWQSRPSRCRQACFKEQLFKDSQHGAALVPDAGMQAEGRLVHLEAHLVRFWRHEDVRVRVQAPEKYFDVIRELKGHDAASSGEPGSGVHEIRPSWRHSAVQPSPVRS